jgi:DNA-binding CsgD family transcriptional regulator
MDRSVFAGLYGEARRFSLEGEPSRLLDRFEARLRRCGATHVLLCGLPLPRRSMAKLIVRIDWPDLRSGGHLLELSPADALLVGCLGEKLPFVVVAGMIAARGAESEGEARPLGASDLLEAAGGRSAVVVVVPIHELAPWQGCVVLAGSELAIDPAALGELAYFCREAMRTLIAQGRVDGARPGELSERERHVLQLTAIGKTAAEIAELLDISQRTVHAHLQNAGEKMNASNKTHTVTEALRYGQIRL